MNDTSDEAPTDAAERTDAVNPQPSSGSERRVDLHRLKRSLLWASLVGLAALPALAFRREALYSSACIVQYEREPGIAAASTDASNEEWFATQDFMVSSNAVLERVVDKLHLQGDRHFFLAVKGRPLNRTRTEAVALLRERLWIRRVEGTRLVRIAVEDPDAARAARIANTIAETYVQKTVADRNASTERALEWLGEQIDQTRGSLERTEGELRDYLQKDVDSSLPLAEREQLVGTQIKLLSDALTAARLRRIALAASVAKLKDALREDPYDIYTQQVGDNEQVKQLKAEQLTARLRYQELVNQSSEESLSEIQRRKLDGLREQLKLTVDGIVRSAQAELTEAISVETAVQDELKQASAVGRQLQLQEVEHGRTLRERAATEAALEALRARASAVANTGGATGAQIVELAAPAPTRRSLF